jgi:hypothetical protein
MFDEPKNVLHSKNPFKERKYSFDKKKKLKALFKVQKA